MEDEQKEPEKEEEGEPMEEVPWWRVEVEAEGCPIGWLVEVKVTWDEVNVEPEDEWQEEEEAEKEEDKESWVL